MKYIVLQHKERNGVIKDTGVIFTPNLVHKDVAESIMHQIAMEEGYMARVVGAGFVSLSTRTCGGKSESLNIGSRGLLDAAVLGL